MFCQYLDKQQQQLQHIVVMASLIGAQELWVFDWFVGVNIRWPIGYQSLVILISHKES